MRGKSPPSRARDLTNSSRFDIPAPEHAGVYRVPNLSVSGRERPAVRRREPKSIQQSILGATRVVVVRVAAVIAGMVVEKHQVTWLQAKSEAGFFRDLGE